MKRIFISDVHMGDDRSVQNGSTPGARPYPYGWFHDERPRMLARFLDTCLERRNEVVILGDLFDQWICPVDSVPPSIEDIVNAGQNAAVVKSLRDLGHEGLLAYLPGNHDMLAEKTEVQKVIKGINYIFYTPEGENDHNVFKTNDGIWAEHGHWYGLFNSPRDPSSDVGPFRDSILSLGFFVSRIQAHKVRETGEDLGPFDLLRGWRAKIAETAYEAKRNAIDKGLSDSGIADAIAEAVDECVVILFRELTQIPELKNQNVVAMKGFGGFAADLTWDEVLAHYRHSLADWEQTHVHCVEAYDATLHSDAGDLRPAARWVFDHISLKSKPPGIVVLGHTHGWTVQEDVGLSRNPQMHYWGPRNVYVNSGGWDNATHRCTFVETEYDPSKKAHVVALKEFTASCGERELWRTSIDMRS